jgi:hypothetical protein
MIGTSVTTRPVAGSSTAIVSVRAQALSLMVTMAPA